ncbi:MAG: LysM peptidoglycan-binding domain-containing protein [Anaerolineaceae bacterium]|nr:LysM peptidoglycan-binding domain-containing protein [Anaerolineaceae bacterium]
MTEKKGIFDKAIDALTNRDEKEAALEAAKQAAEAEARAKAAEEKLEAIKDAKEKEAAKAKAKEIRDAAVARAREAADKMKAAKIIAEHTVKQDETLSHIALKYYGHATPPYWQYVYDTNKEAIGPNMKLMQVGTKLVIMELTDELKK